MLTVESEAIHPSLWTYTRSVHSLGADGGKAFCVGGCGDSSIDVCLHRNASFGFRRLSPEDFAYRTRETNIKHRATPVIHDFAMAAFA